MTQKTLFDEPEVSESFDGASFDLLRPVLNYKCGPCGADNTATVLTLRTEGTVRMANRQHTTPNTCRFRRDVIGKTFHRLTAISEAGHILSGGQPCRVVLCRCTCGKTIEVRVSQLTRKDARATKSCGCLSIDHGYCIKKQHYLYQAWASLKNRCLNAKCHGYINYGGRGISVYDAWRDDFRAFESYVMVSLGPRPSNRHSIDRIDNDGNYEPGNIRWATAAQQCRNVRRNRWVWFKGERRLLIDAAEECGLSPQTIDYRVRSGASGDDIFLPPNRNGNRNRFSGEAKK